MVVMVRREIRAGLLMDCFGGERDSLTQYGGRDVSLADGIMLALACRSDLTFTRRAPTSSEL